MFCRHRSCSTVQVAESAFKDFARKTSGEASSLAITHAESESTNIQRWGSFMSVSACGCKQLQAMATELFSHQQAMQCCIAVNQAAGVA